MSIPKNMFFIWFGDYVPNHILWTIDCFKKVNPDFSVEFIRENVDSINNKKCSSIVNDTIDELLDNYQFHKERLYGCSITNPRFIVLLSDILRFKLTDKYGGIYLDCDCFPIKPFDCAITALRGFYTTRYHRDHKTIDNYFFGSEAGYGANLEGYMNGKCKDWVEMLDTPKGWECQTKFIKNRYKFFRSSLDIGEYSFDKNKYIDHYCDGNWKNSSRYGIRIPITKWDN